MDEESCEKAGNKGPKSVSYFPRSMIHLRGTASSNLQTHTRVIPAYKQLQRPSSLTLQSFLTPLITLRVIINPHILYHNDASARARPVDMG